MEKQSAQDFFGTSTPIVNSTTSVKANDFFGSATPQVAQPKVEPS